MQKETVRMHNFRKESLKERTHTCTEVHGNLQSGGPWRGNVPRLHWSVQEPLAICA